MAGDIRNLSAIRSTIGVVVLRISAVERLLPGVTAMEYERVLAGKNNAQIGCEFCSKNLHITEVHHHPSVLAIAFGNGYNLVFHLIEIHICFGAQLDALKASNPAVSAAEQMGIFGAKVVLSRLLRLQIRAA